MRRCADAPMRRCADAPQYLSDSQLRLGVNDVAAAKAMHLTAIPFSAAEEDGVFVRSEDSRRVSPPAPAQ